MIDIANRYNVNDLTIFRIAKGYSYYNPELKYPLRLNNHEHLKKDAIIDYFSSTEELINLKEDLLYRWDLTIEEDLRNKYNLPLRIIRDINQGRKFADIGNFTYPIRAKNIRNNTNLSQDDIKNILSLLSNTTMSMVKIGEKYNIHRNTVANINKGVSYQIKNY